MKLVRILKDVSDMDPRDGRMLLSLLAYPLEGLRIHAAASGMSKPTVFRHIHRIAKAYPEIRTLLRLRKSLLKPAPERGNV